MPGFSTADDFPFSQTGTAFNSSFFGKHQWTRAAALPALNRLRSPLNTPRNLTGKEVWIRVEEVYRKHTPRVEQDFALVWRTQAAGLYLWIRMGGTLPRPFDRQSDDSANFGRDFTKTMLETLRFPARCFAGVSRFNIKSIQAIHLELNRKDGRPLAFDQLQII